MALAVVTAGACLQWISRSVGTNNSIHVSKHLFLPAALQEEQKKCCLAWFKECCFLPPSCRLFKIQLCSSTSFLQYLAEGECAGYSCWIPLISQVENCTNMFILCFVLKTLQCLCLVPFQRLFDPSEYQNSPPNGLYKVALLWGGKHASCPRVTCTNPEVLCRYLPGLFYTWDDLYLFRCSNQQYFGAAQVPLAKKILLPRWLKMGNVLASVSSVQSAKSTAKVEAVSDPGFWSLSDLVALLRGRRVKQQLPKQRFLFL